jgi:hypothetical protein
MLNNEAEYMTQKTSIQGWVPLLVILVVIIVAIVFVTFDGGLPAGTGNTTGTLTGKVSIGPLCPVEPCTIPHDRLVAAYAARPITISTPDGIVVTTVTPDPENGYTVTLIPGMYIVTIPKQGIGMSPELPATVIIRSGEMVRLDISIDTGIR